MKRFILFVCAAIYSTSSIAGTVINQGILNLLLNDDQPIIILAMGQSNSIGRGVGGDFGKNNNVTVWNNRNEVTGVSDIGDRFVLANRDQRPFANSWNNMFIHTANHISRSTGREVRLMLVGKGSMSLSNWESKSSPMYVRTKAVLNKSKVSKVDLVLWHQGEADSNNGYQTYASRWSGFRSNMLSDGFTHVNTKFITGEISPLYPAHINSILKGLEDSKTRLAEIGHLPTKDGTHYTAQSLILAGEIYARRYFDIAEGDFKDVAIDPNPNEVPDI